MVLPGMNEGLPSVGVMLELSTGATFIDLAGHPLRGICMQELCYQCTITESSVNCRR
jgi:hypothetical protein